jgi:hypothetical protein
MENARIKQAAARIAAALERIAAVPQPCPEPASSAGAANSARVALLVNSHEQLREDVAETLRDLDALIGQLEA